MTTKLILEAALEKAITYHDYRKMVDRLYSEGKTTGSNQNEAMVYYTGLNIQRMQKWEKRFESSPESQEVMATVQDELWLVITEGWCGDAAHVLPVIHKLTEGHDGIEFKVVLRDENPGLMDQYLTNGGRSIPKLIRLRKESLEEIGNWGPRPQEAQNIFKQMKAAGESHDEYTKAIQLWYSRNRGKAIEQELVQMIQGVTV